MKFTEDSSTSSSSSIGKNSDLTEEMRDVSKDDDDEVQSKFNKTGAFDSLQDLEELLPIRRGISSFYSGKSKSFASLSYLMRSGSAKDIAKPDNAYNRKRRNLIASASHVWDSRDCKLHRSSGGGIRKRGMCASRSTLALGVAMSRSSSSSGSSEDFNCSRTGSLLNLPPLHPN